MIRWRCSMCTSFVWRKNDVIIAMNFDDTTPFSVSLKNPNQFTVIVDGAPSFGIRHDGIFVNHLMVDSNGHGQYRRGKNVRHTINMLRDLLGGKIPQDQIGHFLSEKEIVNVPNHNCHSLISDGTGHVWVVEPGRGMIDSPARESDYVLMTNFSLCDAKTTGKCEGMGVDRYATADDLLSQVDNLDVVKAFDILKAVKQVEGAFPTAFSMVYSARENVVYYCYAGNFEKIETISLASD